MRAKLLMIFLKSAALRRLRHGHQYKQKVLVLLQEKEQALYIFWQTKIFLRNVASCKYGEDLFRTRCMDRYRTL